MARKVFSIGCVLVAAVIYFLLPMRGTAQTIIGVNTPIDQNDFDLLDGICDCDLPTPGPQCSLRAAMENANFIGGWVIVAIPNGIYSIDLVGLENACRFGDLDVYSGTLTQLDIAGGGMNMTTIDAIGLFNGGGPERVLDIRSTVGAALTINITDLTMTGGRAFALGETKGGAVRISGGAVTMRNVRVSGSQSNDDGGGIWDESATTLTLVDTFIDGNTAPAVSTGGGIRLDNAARLVATGGGINNNITGIRGGGVRVPAGCSAEFNAMDLFGNAAGSGAGVSNDGVVVVDGGFHTLNIAAGSGGAYENRAGAMLTIRDAQIDSNQAQFGGAINNSGTATIERCWFTGNTADTGGGLQNNLNGTMNLSSSTVSGNTANDVTGGGGIRNSGRLSAVNCTISSNRAPNGLGAGIYFNGGFQVMDLAAVTIALNQSLNGGAGVYIDDAFGNTQLQVIGTLIAENTQTNGNPANFLGNYLMSSFGFNLDTDGSCLLAGPGDQSGVFANIGPLQNNGGPAPTHELLPGSPAIDNGACNDVAGNVITTDERGVLRIGACDVGAYETPSPPNDDCANAMLIGAGGWVWDNCGATTDGPAEPCGFTGVDDKDVWYEFVMPCDGTFVLHVGPSPLGRTAGVYDACPPMGSLIACDMQPAGAAINLAVAGVAGESFLLRVGSAPGTCGNAPLVITVTCNCPWDIAGSGGPGPDGQVNIFDLLLLLGGWNSNGPGADLAPPVNNIDVFDLLEVLGQWGLCP